MKQNTHGPNILSFYLEPLMMLKQTLDQTNWWNTRTTNDICCVIAK